MVIDGSDKFNLPFIVAATAAEHIDFDPTNDGAVDFLEVAKIDELAIDRQIEIATILAKCKFDVLKNLSCIGTKAQVDIVDCHLMPGTTGQPTIANASKSCISGVAISPNEIGSPEITVGRLPGVRIDRIQKINSELGAKR
ncbi:MAG: hypothetical protein R2867_23370 [Caldilineaceae bacterium]